MASRKTTVSDEPDAFTDPNPTERRVRLAADNARLLEAEREARARAEQAVHRVSRLQAMTASLAEALTREEVADAILREGLPAFGAFAGSVATLVDGDRLELLKREGYGHRSADSLSRWDVLAMSEPMPTTDAVRTQAPVTLTTFDEWLARYPHVADLVQHAGTRAFVAIPLVVSGRAIGAFTLSFDHPRGFDGDDLGFLLALGRQCAQALERARLYLAAQTARAEAEENERRQRLLADASRALGASLDYETTLNRIAQLAVPDVADWCAVDILEPDGVTLRRMAAAHRDPNKAKLCLELARQSPSRVGALLGAGPLAQGGTAQLVADVSLEKLRARTLDASELAIVDALAVRSAIFVPLVARDRVLGTLTFAYAESGRHYRDADVPFVEELARRAGMAIDNARLYREAERVNHAKDEFLATLSHELRNPLNAMLGWTRLLRAGGLDAKTSERALETVERNARSQAQLIEDLLDVSRIITGKMRLNVIVCDLRAVIEAAIDTLRPAADARDIAIECAFDEAASSVSGDADRLQQVVWNLLSNAIKFTAAGGKITVSLARVQTGAELRVKDSGRGIPLHFLPYVFDRFRQADSSTTRAHSGLGLGLAITRHLVELHGGTIHAESGGEGTGATFIVRLPFRGARVQTPWPGRRSAPAGGDAHVEPGVLNGLHIVAVDDDADARDLLQTMLGQHGASARVLGSAADALRALEESPPDALLSDIGMPAEDGFHLIASVRAHADPRIARVPAIAVTAYAHAEDERRVLAAGYDAHVAKPIEPSSLAALLGRIARRA